MSEDIVNNSGLVPRGRAVLIKPYQPERKKGLIEIPGFVQAIDNMIEQRAVVIAIGPSCWPDEPPRAKIGEKVLVAKYAGHMAIGTKDEEQYRFINDRDIFAAIEVE